MPLPWPLSAPWPSLSIPSGFSFASLHDTRHWQRRLLRYVIRRALGGILLLPEESIDEHTHLDADLGSGNVQLKNVKLDATAINAQLATYIDNAGIPLHVELLDGSIGAVQLLLGNTEHDDTPARPLTATERLFTAPIQLKISEAVLEVRIRALVSSKQDAEPTHGVDLAASIANVAEGYINETSAQEILEEEEDEEDPFALPGGFDRPSGSANAPKDEEQVGIVAAIIERILARLQLSIKDLRLRIHLVHSDSEDIADLEFRLEKAESQTIVQQGEKGTSFVRLLSATDPSIWFREGSKHGAPSSSDSGSSDTSISDDMAMSMAVADLRTSHMSERIAANSSLEASQSIYFSTELDREADPASVNPPSTRAHELPPNSEDGAARQSRLSDAWIQLFGCFPTELVSEVVARFTVASEHDSGSSRLEITAPRLGFLVTPPAVSALSRLAKGIPSRSASIDRDQALLHPDSPNLLLYSRISGLEAFVPLSTSESNPSLSGLMTSDVVPNQVLHFSLSEIEGAYRLSAAEGKVAVKRYCLAIEGPSYFRPLIMPDPGLAWAYSASSLNHGDSISSTGDWQRTVSQPSRPEAWRVAVPVNASSLNSQSKTPVLGDSLAVRVSRQAFKVTLQPVHIWADSTLIAEMLEALTIYTSAVAPHDKQEPAATSPYADTSEGKPSCALTLEMACLRVDLRVDNPSSRILRAGILTLDLHDLSITRQLDSYTHTPLKARFDQDIPSSTSSKIAEISCQFLFAFVASTKLKKNGATCFLAAKASTSSIISVQALQSSDKPGAPLWAKILVPTVGLFINKSINDSLQYLADDITQTLLRYAKSAEEAEQALLPTIPTSASKATFKSLSSASSSSKESDGSSNSRSPIAGVDISVIEVHIRICAHDDTPGAVELVLTAVDTMAKVELRHNGSDDLVIDVSSDSASCSKVEAGSQTCLLRKLAHSTLPIFKLRLTSLADPQIQAKHSRVRLTANSFLCNLPSKLDWATQLADTFKAPAGVFTDVVPNDSTKIEVTVNESIVRLLPPEGHSALAVNLGQLRYKVQLLREETAVKGYAAMHETEVWVADHAVSGDEGVHPLKSLGSARLAFLKFAECHLVHNSNPETKLDILAKHITGRVEACPDTLLVLGQLLQSIVPAKDTATSARRSAPLADLSGSICLPRNDVVNQVGTSKTSMHRQIVSQADDITLAAIGHGKIAIEETWFSKQKITKQKTHTPPSIHFRLEGSDFAICLYEGYDFERSRKFVKDTVKATRKRLEKIRQLIAEGQVPDETVEEAAESLLQSVFLPPQKASGAEADDLDTFERIAAFDDELDRDDVTTYSWETVPQRPNMRRTFSNGSAKQTGARLRRLRRPKLSALDINLTGLSTTLNLYGDTSALASRISLEIHELGIIDNLRTSSWNKFLTELRPRDGGILRPTASPMVKVQLSMVKGAEVPEQQEANLKVKVCPLRLHIDQDALDFLKAFAAFKMESPLPSVHASSTSSESKANGGFVQRVEIFPIKIKLDYKPKRVDYQALRQGRTIELMNFFSFEASEMVLRHLILNGVPSWAKVGDFLQDIWTPDVKANQLADFLAGINPVRSVVNVGSGVADLVLLPVQQYKKDGRLVRGVQRGSKSFAKTTALEAIKLGARMATGTQVILEHAERVLGGRPPQGGSPVTTPSHQDLFLEDMEEEDELNLDTTENLSRFSKQPGDVREGIQTAYKSLSGNMRTAAETILAVPMEVYEHSDEGPARAVVRAVPIAVLRPMIGASEAVSKTLLGLRNTLDPGARGEIQDKYKRPSSST